MGAILLDMREVLVGLHVQVRHNGDKASEQREDVKRLANTLNQISDRLVEFNTRLANLEIRGAPQDHDVLPALKRIGYLLGSLDSRLGDLELTAPCKASCPKATPHAPPFTWPQGFVRQPAWIVGDASQLQGGGPK